MKRINIGFLLIFSVLIFFSACNQSETHFLKDEKYRTEVHDQFLKRKDLAGGRSKQLFSVFDRDDLTIEKREALEFLYAYMPLSDLADYDGEFFLGQVDAAFEARDYFDWGKKIPEDIFRHFVLVYRVNNENLDTARQAFFDELKDRVKGLTMEKAVLEVNHWCHEKVTYRGTDGRTSSPLALAKTSWGRCGEESTFTTAALRAVGIPARQCYTPRWVHTDDNHAWVEVWVDGEWHYIGACEPEPELDVAWFSAPVKRAMMVHTNVFGLYNGPEEKNVQNDLYSVINLLGNYTTTRDVKVKVVDEDGKAVDGATVRFNVYNYAEFYPIATSQTKEDGMASIISGMGDIFVWASKGDMYGYAKSTIKTGGLTVVLKNKAGESFEETIIMEAPIEQSIKELSAEKIAENAKRLAHEDSIRNAYMGTFITETDARKFALDNSLDTDKVWDYLSKSQGNWNDMMTFIKEKKSNGYLYSFIESLKDKDLRDTPCGYLSDHLNIGDDFPSNKMTAFQHRYAQYILSPRIALELIRPWRGFFKKELSEVFIDKSRSDIQTVIDFVRDNVKIDDEQNYFKCPISPQGVYELKIADRHSRDIFFVALCRSMDILARIDPVTNRPQYLKAEDNLWTDVYFDEKIAEQPKATITFTNNNGNIVKPGYSTHFTIARFENGSFTTLDFENEVKSLPASVSVDAGYYRLMIGSRANDGSVTIDTRYFEVKEKEIKSLEIKLPKVEGRIQVQGIVDPNTVVTLNDGSKKSLKELMNKKGLVICFADPDKEPTKHILQDLPLVKQPVEEWGGGILFAVPDDKLSKAFDASVFKDLPKQSLWMTDDKRVLLNSVAGALQIDFSNNFPLTVYLSTNGGILYSSQGYRIGIGENIIKTIEEEKTTK
ncbi:transglutaminase domain-containing protein [Dysgonomonas sp. Marseille-P4677]|uniref:transglutaminase-like domain-containing protein n=1 Tax=Dysgonomonas sp. Marseille-P4677 TaxID=2364790 RepID=UPI00191197AA|nr:transglutaminase-like domain-containing protein [Dysgonomonas sp. Marseille-P4677]MBK5719334.1 transglutaminase domain-containing protein [Dysgonomonas sp. Marseille-P4677]